MAIGIEALKFYPMRLNLLKRPVLIILLYARIQCIKVADEIERHIHIPLLHIAEMTAVELEKSGITKVGLTWYQVH